MGEITLEQIHDDLNFLKKEIIEIKKHMVDVDTILTPVEDKELDKSIENFKREKTKSFDKIKDDLGL